VCDPYIYHFLRIVERWLSLLEALTVFPFGGFGRSDLSSPGPRLQSSLNRNKWRIHMLDPATAIEATEHLVSAGIPGMQARRLEHDNPIWVTRHETCDALGSLLEVRRDRRREEHERYSPDPAEDARIETLLRTLDTVGSARTRKLVGPVRQANQAWVAARMQWQMALIGREEAMTIMELAAEDRRAMAALDKVERDLMETARKDVRRLGVRGLRS
jgi:hypothetical protein